MSAKGKVLIVENDRRARQTSQRVLWDAGFVVEAVDTVADALDLLTNHAIQVVLLDASTPEANGLAGLQAIKKRDPGTEVVIMSETPTWQQAKEAIRLGASDYLARSASITKLVSAVAHAAIHKKWALQRIDQPALEGDAK